ncbi:PAS domain S-box protein [Candidatus Omnitrophota bacterium]
MNQGHSQGETGTSTQGEQLYLDIVDVMILVVGRDEKVKLINKKGCKLLGFSENDVLGKNWFDAFLPVQSRDEIRSLFHDVIEGRRELVEYYESSIVTKEREERKILWRNSVVRNDQGEIVATLSSGEDVTDRRRDETAMGREREIQSAISAVLHISLEPISLLSQLKKILDLILSLPWLAIQSKGCIFLLDQNSGKMEMKVQKGLEEELLVACKSIGAGRCLCGRAALSRKMVFKDSIDECHDINFPGMKPHGHYCVPILSGDHLLGVINLYVDAGHKKQHAEVVFLQALSDTLAGIIEHKQTEAKLRDSEEELREQKNVLEKKNIAMQEIIAQIEIEKNKLKSDIDLNVKVFLLPALDKLKLKGATKKYIDLIKDQLTNLTSSFGREITDKSIKLTAREIEICNFIKGGLSSKEIAKMLNLSPQTIEKHRKNIRKKMGLSHKEINLASYLQAE